jgi:Flp pilus assembly pilin Flp
MLRRFGKSQDGATAVHFAVMLALIAIVWLTAVASLTNGTN